MKTTGSRKAPTHSANTHKYHTNYTGSFGIKPCDAGKIVIVRNLSTGKVKMARVDDIIKAHAHTATWCKNKQWHGNSNEPSFVEI